MHHAVKRHIACLVITAMLVALYGVPALAQIDQHKEEIQAEAMLADALVVRPLGALSTIAGFAAFIISLPFSAWGGNVDKAYQKMVVEPAKFTFKRPLGEF